MLQNSTLIRWLLSLSISIIIFVGIVSCSDTVSCTTEECPKSKEDTVVELVMNTESCIRIDICV